MSVLANTIFYDIESSGLDTAFDQVLQFYGCRLDEHGEVVEEVHLHVQSLVDCVADPGAVLVHRIVPSFYDGLPEPTAMQEIHRFLNTAGCRNGGYNTLGFDDEFLRFSFYRNFLNPYQHQWAQGCSRMDIFPVVAFFAVMDQKALEWPERNGRLSLKLDDLNKANNWLEGQAHDASFDVKVTLKCAQALCKFKEKFEFVMSYFQKDVDKSRINKFCKEYCKIPYALMLDTRFSYANQFLKPVVFIGYHKIYRNQSVWLPIDKPLWDVGKDSLTKIIYKKKLGEPGFVLPFNDDYVQKLGQRRQIADENLAWLASNAGVIDSLKRCLVATHEPIDGLDPDAQLYQLGLLSQEQCYEQARLLTASYSQRKHIVEQAVGSYRDRAMRFCLRHDAQLWQELASASNRHYISALLSDHSVSIFGQKKQLKRSLGHMIKRLDDEQSTHSDQDQNLLMGLMEHYNIQADRLKQLLSKT